MDRLTEWNSDKSHGQLIKGDGITKLCRYEDSYLQPENLPRIHDYAMTLIDAIDKVGDNNLSYCIDTPLNALGWVSKNSDTATFGYSFNLYYLIR